MEEAKATAATTASGVSDSCNHVAPRTLSTLGDALAVFRNPATELQLLLCYDAAAEKGASSQFDALCDRVSSQLSSSANMLSCFLWDCGNRQSEGLSAGLGKREGQPLLAVIHKGVVADVFHCCRDRDHPLLVSEEEVQNLSTRLMAVVDARGVAGVPGSSINKGGEKQLTVNISAMLELGKRNLQSKEDRVGYARKAFAKAVSILDAVEPEVRQQSHSAAQLQDFYGSLATSLGWWAMADMIDGVAVKDCTAWQRLCHSPVLQLWCAEPRSDVLRAITLGKLIGAAGPALQWKGQSKACSQTALRAYLQEHPCDVVSRQRLVVTLFLAGDLERCVTEVLKLRSLAKGSRQQEEGEEELSGATGSYGDVALVALETFCGHSF